MHIMKKYILIFLCLITVSGSFAQMQDFKFKFYGQIRTDFYYNSRANEETVDGLFYMYPKDKVRVKVTPEAVEKIGEAGFDDVYGARPLRRAITARIEDPIPELMPKERSSPADLLQSASRTGNSPSTAPNLPVLWNILRKIKVSVKPETGSHPFG